MVSGTHHASAALSSSRHAVTLARAVTVVILTAVWVAWLHIAALCSIAVAQPLLAVLGASPEFFIAHRAGAPEILLLVFVLVFLCPTIVAACVWLAGLAGSRARVASLSLALAALAGVLVMQVAIRAGATSWFLASPIAVVAGAALAIAYHRFAPVRSFFTVLSAATLVVPAVFLLGPGIRPLIAADLSAVSFGSVAGGSDRPSNDTPVVLIIFDELPLVSLLDRDRHIDRQLYPNLSALARDGIWFRNATTVNDFTRWAVPSIVSGTYPRASALPAAIDHPNTLFTLLARTHRLEVRETVTSLCPRALCQPEARDTSLGRRLVAIAKDVRVVFLRMALTADLTARLPDPTEGWAGFGGEALPSTSADIEEEDARAAAQEQWRLGMVAARVTPVRQFIDGISKDDEQPTFYFMHTLVSHHPYYMLPGNRENKTWVDLPGKVGGSWDKNQAWAVAQQYQRHLLQAEFVDELVGQLVKRLKDSALYDRAAIVITADHGVSHTPGTPQRNMNDRNAAEVMRVPLIVKLPKRLGVLRRTSDVNAETVDILPTIADAVGVQVPWPIDGTSLLDPARPQRRSKVMFSGATGRRRDIPADWPNMEPAIRRKVALFGDGKSNAERAPLLAPYDRLLGRPVAELRVTDDGGRVELTHASDFESVDPTAPAVVFDVAGRFSSPRPDTVVAVAVNGVVEAVTRTWESNPRGWLATPRFDVWRRGRNTVDVFVVDRDLTGLFLRRAGLGTVRPPGLNLVSDEATNWGVRQWGFYPTEGPAGGNQFRWTREQAELSNVVTHERPRAVQIDVVMVPAAPKVLKIEANECTLFEGVVGAGWSSTLSFERCPIDAKGLTLRLTTDAPRGTTDRRRLGVAVSRVVLR